MRSHFAGPLDDMPSRWGEPTPSVPIRRTHVSTAATVNARRGERRTAFFFGAPESPLYGCLHEPSTGAAPGAGVVLCYPIGHEYLNAHRSFAQLAARLAGAGFAALRFDYAGTGDSAGDAAQMSVERWIADIRTAVREVRASCGVERVSLVGLRLGALLAMHAAQPGAHSVALWDPVVRGRDYLEELERLHEETLRYAYVTPERAGGAQAVDEFLGFPLPENARVAIEALDLDRERQITPRLLVIESEPTRAVAQWRGALAGTADRTDHQVIAAARIWQKEPLEGIVPHNLLEGMVSWLVGAHA